MRLLLLLFFCSLFNTVCFSQKSQTRFPASQKTNALFTGLSMHSIEGIWEVHFSAKEMIEATIIFNSNFNVYDISFADGVKGTMSTLSEIKYLYTNLQNATPYTMVIEKKTDRLMIFGEYIEMIKVYPININDKELQSSSESTKNNIRIRVSDINALISKVAVIGKESSLCDGSKDDGKSLAEVVEGELLGIYGVVERRHLEEIIDEQRLAMSGLLLEDSDFAQAGCLAGAQGTVLASYGCLQGQTKLQVKLVDCSTSDLYWSATGLDVASFDLMDALRIELSK